MLAFLSVGPLEVLVLLMCPATIAAMVLLVVFLLRKNQPTSPGNLVRCPACGHGCSPQAVSCPNCGHPFTPPPSSSGAA